MDMKRSPIVFLHFFLAEVFQTKELDDSPKLETNHTHCKPCKCDVVERTSQMKFLSTL